HDIFLQSWSPFIANKNKIFNHPLLLCMAKKYSKTPAQIILNFLYKLGILLIPKSSNLQRMKQNLQIFDFELEDEDTQKLIYLDQNKSFFGWYD
ncbi:aldo/keto reductase, partial [Campylobacter coli]|nr:aldo/keto reductase [Campylobacter coli]